MRFLKSIKGKRKLFALLLHDATVFHLVNKMMPARLAVLNYHRLKPDDPKFRPIYDDDIFGPTASEFEKQLRWLKKHTHIISEEELVECMETGKFPSKLNVLITFDDGYIGNYSIAFPILQRFGVSAIFFIPTGMITKQFLGWWDISAFLIKNSRKNKLVFGGREIELKRGLRAAIHHIHASMRLMSPRESQLCIESLSQMCEVDIPDQDEQGKQLMSWTQICEMSDSGMAIGSHTHTHPVLSSLSCADQKKEMLTSRSIIENITGSKVRSIAYPIGSYRHFTQETMMIAEQSGYSAGFSFDNGINYCGDLKPYDIRRIAPGNNFYITKSLLVLPGSGPPTQISEP